MQDGASQISNLYDTFSKSQLDGSSLTFQWLADGDDNNQKQTFICGTNRSEETKQVGANNQIPRRARNYLRVGNIDWEDSAPKIDIFKLFPHEGSVNIARSVPRFSNIVASASRKVSVYDIREDSNTRPLVTIDYHVDDCWSLSWSPFEWSTLITGAHDSRIAIWDLYATPAEANGPVWSAKAPDMVNNVQWHPSRVRVFGAAIENGEIWLQDARDYGKCLKSEPATHGLNSLSFSPTNDNLVATGDTNARIHLRDLRRMDRPLDYLNVHSDAINQVEWSPDYDGLLASCSDDATVALWDIKRLGHEQEPLDWEDGPPELLFRQRVHSGRIDDMGWNPNVLWNLASVDDNGDLVIWTPETSIVVDQDSRPVRMPSDLEG